MNVDTQVQYNIISLSVPSPASTMTIHSLYILSKSGGLIYQHDHNLPTIENEKTFSFPLELKLDVQNRNIVVSFGQRDGIKGNVKLQGPETDLSGHGLTFFQ